MQYLRNVRSVGAVAPSSRFLARKMVETIDFERAGTIVEYGPGTGVFTKEILARMRPGTKVLLIESNDDFYEKLRTEYEDRSDVHVAHDSAEHVAELLAERGLGRPDYVVSGLPFAALPAAVSERILTETARLLSDGGEFVTFQYTLLKKGVIGCHFGTVRVTRELRNLPPAYVLRCRNQNGPLRSHKQA